MAACGTDPGRAQHRARLLQPRAKGPPAGGIGGPLIGQHIGDIGLLPAKLLGNRHRKGRVAFQHVQTDMGRRHGQAIGLQPGGQFIHLGLRLVEAPEAFDGLVARFAQHFQRVGQRREVPRGINLVTDHGVSFS